MKAYPRLVQKEPKSLNLKDGESVGVKLQITQWRRQAECICLPWKRGHLCWWPEKAIQERTLDSVGALGKWAQAQSSTVVVAGRDTPALSGPPFLSRAAYSFSLTLDPLV